MESERTAREGTVARLVDEVSGWPHVTTGTHRFGGTEFLVGTREIGHIHAGGTLDVAYRRALRDALVEAGHTGVHHRVPESGWTTFRIGSGDDYEHARWLLRLSYLYHVDALRRTPSGAEELGDVDVDAELSALDVGADVRAAFGRRAA